MQLRLFWFLHHLRSFHKQELFLWYGQYRHGHVPASRSAYVLPSAYAYPDAYPNADSYPYSYSYSQPQSAVYEGDQHQFPYTSDPEELAAAGGRSRSRGVSLADNGPVPAPGGVRRISRQTRRSTTQVPAQQNPNRYSRGNSVPLPPGAAPPQPGTGYGY